MTEHRIAMIDGNTKVVSHAAAQALAATLSGSLLSKDDPDYDAARTVWNATVNRRPALIARCTSTQDVVNSVCFAREHDLLVSVRGGGHSSAGRAVCDNGLMIDLAPMQQIDVDPATRIATAQPGVKLSQFDTETQKSGLATTLGVASDTGIAGLTLGGGYGWLNGKHGLACDNLLSAEIITADGECRTASPESNPDLFWGLRGAGANFGIVTAFRYRLHPVGPVLGGLVLYPIDDGRNVLRRYHEVSAACPDDVSTVGLLVSTPDGTKAIGIVACHAGPLDAGEQALKPFRTIGTPIADLIQPRPYIEMQSLFDAEWAPGRSNYWKTSLMRAPDDSAIETMLAHARMFPTPACAIYLQQLHGAAARIGPADTAFPHRFYHYDCGPWATWEDPADTDRCIAWARDCWQALRPFYAPGAYVNAVDDPATDDDDRIRSAYGQNYDRLRTLKTRYDPANRFRLNANIPPG